MLFWGDSQRIAVHKGHYRWLLGQVAPELFQYRPMRKGTQAEWPVERVLQNGSCLSQHWINVEECPWGTSDKTVEKPPGKWDEKQTGNKTEENVLTTNSWRHSLPGGCVCVCVCEWSRSTSPAGNYILIGAVCSFFRRNFEKRLPTSSCAMFLRSTRRISRPVSATFRIVCLNAQTIESRTSLNLSGDSCNNAGNVCVTIACRSR